MNFQEFVTFPLRDREWVKKVLIGCVISIVPVLNLLVLGYFIACMQMGIRGREVLPEWDDLGKFVRDGIMAFLILIIYSAIPVMLGFILNVLPFIGIFISSILTMVVGIIIPFALANYAYAGEFIEAFRFSDIIYKIRKTINSYAPAYLLMAIIITVGMSAILLVPFVAFLGVLLVFYAGVVFSNMVGQLCRETTY